MASFSPSEKCYATGIYPEQERAMEKFTASEVRERAKTFGAGDIYRMLNAFADLLEAQEKAAPVMVVNHVSSAEHDLPIGMKLYTHPAPADAEPPSSLQEALCVLENAALHGLVLHGDDISRLRATVDKIAQDKPRPDAERLAEALRNLVSEWVAIADDGDMTLEDSTIGYRACANRLSAMLAVHSPQAQPHDFIKTGDPDAAPSICDANGEVVLAYCRKCKQGEGDLAEFCPAQPPAARVTDAMVIRLKHALPLFCADVTMADARAALEAALTAQEDPNG